MKTNAMVTVEREGKTIVIYVNDGDWGSLPDLSFIADVEIYQPERSKREDYECDFCEGTCKYMLSQKNHRCGALNSMET